MLPVDHRSAERFGETTIHSLAAEFLTIIEPFQALSASDESATRVLSQK